MATITTKYSVGDSVYIIDSRGIGNEYIRVVLEDIRKINLGEYGGVRYEFRTQSRDERDIYSDLETAKAAAKKEAKARYEKNLEIIGETSLKPAEIKE